MKKIVRLTESELNRLIRKLIIMEQSNQANQEVNPDDLADAKNPVTIDLAKTLIRTRCNYPADRVDKDMEFKEDKFSGAVFVELKPGVNMMCDGKKVKSYIAMYRLYPEGKGPSNKPKTRMDIY